MPRARFAIGLLFLAVAAQAVVLGALFLLVAQATPNTRFYRDTFVGRFAPLVGATRMVDRAFNWRYRGPERGALPHYKLQTVSYKKEGRWHTAELWADGEPYLLRAQIFEGPSGPMWNVEFLATPLHGMSKAAFMHPADVGWHGALLAQHRAEKMDLVHAPVRFAVFTMNGNTPVTYATQEGWNAELLEKQARSSEARFHTIDAHHHLLPQIPKQMNIDQWLKWYAHSQLTGVTTEAEELRLLYDPTLGLYEPVVSGDQSADHILVQNMLAVPQWKLELQRYLWRYINDPTGIADDLAELEKARASIENALYRNDVPGLSNRQIQAALNQVDEQIKSTAETLRQKLAWSEVLVTQRLPSQQQARDGIGLIIDISARGPAIATLSGLTVPVTLNKDDALRLLLNSTEIPFNLQAGSVNDTLTIGADTVLLVPGHAGDIQTYRLLIMGGAIKPSALPIELDIRNAATGKPANVVGTTVVNNQTYQELRPKLP